MTISVAATLVGCDASPVEVPDDMDSGEGIDAGPPLVGVPDSFYRPDGVTVRRVVAEAAWELAAAQCQHDERCQRSADRSPRREPARRTDARCLEQAERLWSERLSAAECAGGMTREELDACLRVMQTAPCGTREDGGARATACQSSSLCVRATAP